MNNSKQSYLKTLLISLASIALFSTCSDEGISSNDMGYLPLKEGVTWRYGARWRNFSYDTVNNTNVAWDFEMVKIISGDTAIEGKSYKKITDEHGQVIKLVRKVGTRYYYRQRSFIYTGSEIRDLQFLNELLPGEVKWSYLMDDGNVKIEFHQSTRKQYKVNGKIFRNVKVVTVKYYYRYPNDPKTYYLSCPVEKHFYVRDIGEIQELHEGCYGDHEITLLDY